MRRTALLACLLVAACASRAPAIAPSPSPAADPAARGAVRLEVGGTKPGGYVVAALYADDATFLEEGRAAQSMRAVARAGSTAIVLEDVPDGRYAAVVYQDEDGNGRLNRSFVGYPSEPFGFSNDATVGLFGPPSFADCAFRARGPSTVTRLTLR